MRSSDEITSTTVSLETIKNSSLSNTSLVYLQIKEKDDFFKSSHEIVQANWYASKQLSRDKQPIIKFLASSYKPLTLKI